MNEIEAQDYGKKIESVERQFLEQEQISCPLIHRFAPGVYYREIFMPAGTIVIGHEHKTAHFNVITKGRAKVLMNGVTQTITAPCVFTSDAGVRKVLLIEEDMVWATVHPTNETDIVKLEEELIEKSDAHNEWAMRTLCQEKAKVLVAKHRSMLPEGFDPQNTFVATAIGVSAAATIGTTIAGAVAGGPDVPAYQQVKPGDVVHDTLKANEANLEGINALAGRTDTYNQSALDAQLRGKIPNLDKLNELASTNLQDQLEGKLSSAETAAINNRLAASALSGGIAGAPRSVNLAGGAFGAATAQRKQSGLDALSRWLSSVKGTQVAGPINRASMFVTPAEVYGGAKSNSENQFQRDFAQNQIDSYYSPGNQIARGLSGVAGVAGMAAGYYGSRGATPRVNVSSQLLGGNPTGVDFANVNDLGGAGGWNGM